MLAPVSSEEECMNAFVKAARFRNTMYLHTFGWSTSVKQLNGSVTEWCIAALFGYFWCLTRVKLLALIWSLISKFAGQKPDVFFFLMKNDGTEPQTTFKSQFKNNFRCLWSTVMLTFGFINIIIHHVSHVACIVVLHPVNVCKLILFASCTFIPMIVILYLCN